MERQHCCISWHLPAYNVGIRKGKRFNSFRFGVPRSWVKQVAGCIFFDLVLNRFRWVEKKMFFVFWWGVGVGLEMVLGEQCDFMLSSFVVVRLYESRWI